MREGLWEECKRGSRSHSGENRFPLVLSTKAQAYGLDVHNPNILLELYGATTLANWQQSTLIFLALITSCILEVCQYSTLSGKYFIILSSEMCSHYSC